MLTQKTNGLQKTGSAPSGKDVVPSWSFVDIGGETDSSGDKTRRDRYFQLLGRIEGAQVSAGFQASIWAEHMSEMKESGFYRERYETWEAFVLAESPYGCVDAADRAIGFFREFGAAWFITKQFLRMTAARFRRLNIKCEDGILLIDGASYDARKAANGPLIQAAIEAVNERELRTRNALSATKGALTKTQEERDAARKERDNAREKYKALVLAEHHRVEGATEIQQRLYEAQTNLIEVAVLIEGCRRDEHATPEDRVWIEGLMEFAIRILVKAAHYDPLEALVNKLSEDRTPLNHLREKGLIHMSLREE